MELTPDLLLEAKFSSARRGYDMAEVDDFLERCAEGLDVLLARLKSEFERAERAEAALADVHTAPPTQVIAPEAVPEPAPEPEPEFVAEPEPEGAPPRSTSLDVDEPMRVLVMAERTAEATINEARADAERIRGEAESIASRQRSEAERLLTTAKSDAEAEARRAGEAARREIQDEVNDLRRDREGLSTDIRNLRRWLDEQRGRMRTTARELNRLIEDPTALREFAPPELESDDPSSEPTAGTDEAPAEPFAPEEDAQFSPPVEEVDSDGEPTQAVPTVDFGSDDDAGPSTSSGEHRF